jgi:hypothetical protein
VVKVDKNEEVEDTKEVAKEGKEEEKREEKKELTFGNRILNNKKSQAVPKMQPIGQQLSQISPKEQFNRDYKIFSNLYFKDSLSKLPEQSEAQSVFLKILSKRMQNGEEDDPTLPVEKEIFDKISKKRT